MKKVGVIVSRFQIDELSEGHKHLLKYVAKRHDQIFIILGVSPCIGSHRDPLDYKTREQMVTDYGLIELKGTNVNVEAMMDHSSDNVWSNNLDQLIAKHFPHGSVVLYGGRDSFLKHYKGKLASKVIRNKREFSNSTIRRVKIGQQPEPSIDFRRGAIYASQKGYPRLFMCVDVAIVKHNDSLGVKLPTPQILLGRKHAGDRLRFPGGFVDPTDDCLEESAFREMQEECGTSIVPAGGEGWTAMEYVASMLIDDWRYPEGGRDRIMTSFFHLPYGWGNPKAGDDLVEVNWFDLNAKTKSQLGPFHQGLFKALSSYLAHREEKYETVG